MSAPAPTPACYLLHFDRPYRHARHYLGSTTHHLPRRVARHKAGTGARLIQVITAAGIGFVLVRPWPGGRDRERQLKKQGGRSRLSPICKGTMLPTAALTPTPPDSPTV